MILCLIHLFLILAKILLLSFIQENNRQLEPNQDLSFPSLCKVSSRSHLLIAIIAAIPSNLLMIAFVILMRILEMTL